MVYKKPTAKVFCTPSREAKWSTTTRVVNFCTPLRTLAPCFYIIIYCMERGHGDPKSVRYGQLWNVDFGSLAALDGSTHGRN